jgi:hypothetical protein
VKKLSSFLVDTVIPRFLEELTSVGNFTLIDGFALTEAMHTRGINMRYLGRLANQSADLPAYCKVPHFKILVLMLRNFLSWRWFLAQQSTCFAGF